MISGLSITTPCPSADTVVPMSAQALPAERRLSTLVLADEPLTGQALAAAVRASNVIDAVFQPDWRTMCRTLDERRGDRLLWFGDIIDQEIAKKVIALRDAKPDVGVCLLARRFHLPSVYALAAQSASGLSLLLRTEALVMADVVRALFRIDAHIVTLTPEVFEALAEKANAEEIEPFASLSRDERSVLELLALGLRNCEIARRVHRSEKLIEKRVGAIFVKLNLNDVADRKLDRRVAAARVFLAYKRELEILQA